MPNFRFGQSVISRFGRFGFRSFPQFRAVLQHDGAIVGNSLENLYNNISNRRLANTLLLNIHVA